MTEIQNLPKNEYFHRMRKGEPTKKMYMKGSYNKSFKGWEAIDIEDVYGCELYIKKGIKVFIASDRAVDIAHGHEVDED
jgi:hypothetical protein